jgi:hypothetical protein
MLKESDRIVVNRKWKAEVVSIEGLTWNQQQTLDTHLRYLNEGRPVLEGLDFIEGETLFSRGQPETEFAYMGGKDVRVILTGLSHWQIFIDHRMGVGTRDVDKLARTVKKALEKVEVF